MAVLEKSPEFYGAFTIIFRDRSVVLSSFGKLLSGLEGFDTKSVAYSAS